MPTGSTINEEPQEETRQVASVMTKSNWDNLCEYTDDNHITVKNAIAYIVNEYRNHVEQ